MLVRRAPIQLVNPGAAAEGWAALHDALHLAAETAAVYAESMSMAAGEHIQESGRPVVAGTDIKVSQIAAEYEHHRMTPDEIVEAHPHLSLAAVHAALAYYYEHQDAIRQQWHEDRVLVASLRSRYRRTAASA